MFVGETEMMTRIVAVAFLEKNDSKGVLDGRADKVVADSVHVFVIEHNCAKIPVILTSGSFNFVRKRMFCWISIQQSKGVIQFQQFSIHWSNKIIQFH